MPTGQNANQKLAFCPDFYCGWHIVRPNFWLAFCPDHIYMFWHFVRIMKNVLRMILDDLRGSHMFSDDFIIFSVFEGCSPKKAPKSP